MNRLWRNIADFFENGDLVPFAVIVSVYHYWKALEPAGDPILIAIPVAIIVDLLHFRTIRRAVEDAGKRKIIVAVMTTIMALSYHFVFYSQAISDPLLIAMYAIPIPVGIGILAWHQAQGDLVPEQQMKDAEDRVTLLESRLQSHESALQSYKSKLQEQASKVQAEQEAWKKAEAERKQEKAEWAQAQKAWQKEKDELLHEIDTLKNMSPVALDIVLAENGSGLTGRDIAEKHGVSESTVSRTKKYVLNGH